MCCFDRRERRKARFASKSFEGDGAMRTGSTPLLATASRPFLARLVILLDSRRLCAAPSRPRDDCLQAVDAPILRDNSFFSSSFFAPSLTCGLPLLSLSTALPLLPLSLSLSLSGSGGKNKNDDNSTSPTKGGEEASTSAPAASPSPRRRLFGGSRSRSRSPSPGAASPTTIAASNPSTKLAARASAASPSPHSKYAPLTLDQAAAIDENAAAITRRVDAKARKVRGEAAARLFLYLALAALALRLVGPRFGAVVGAILGLAYGQFLRGSVARQWATRRRTHATVARARAALAAAALGGERAAAARSRFDGTWYRDAAASDSMDRALDVMAIRGIVRKAIALVKGLVLKVDCSNGPGSSGLFTLQVFSVIPILKITERYPLTGAPVEHRRRDLRSGRAAGSTELLADGRLRTTLVWEGSKPGSGTDAYEVSADGRTLTVSSFLKVGGETASYRVVYRKAE